jgi:N-acetylglutamate synthase-like GNAT family acetyltransferase
VREPNPERWRERHRKLSHPARKERRLGEWSGRLAETGIEVRWGLAEDEPRIGELLELNGMLRPLAFEERFIVAEKKGRLLAAVRYRTEPKRLLLGLLVADPWAGERRLAMALYAGAGELAREMGVKYVFARSLRHGDYPHEAGYSRTMGGWRLDATRARYRRKELPAGGWRRVIALWGVFAIPFFNLKVRS